MARRKRRNRRERRQRRQAFINLVIVALLISGAVFAFYALQPKPYDEVTLCPVGEDVAGHTAVIIDKTDKYSETEADLIGQAVRRVRDRLEVNERITLLELDARGQFNPALAVSLCNPGRGDQANPIFANPKQIEERYKEKFESRFDAYLEDLVEPKVSPSSPIIEALARLAQQENFSSDVRRRRIVLVSDMLQFSDVFSAYGGTGADLPPDVPSVDQTVAAVERRFGTELRGTNLEVFLIQRDRYADLQRGALRIYWENVMAELGVTVTWRDLSR